jgi:hypothetical protein
LNFRLPERPADRAFPASARGWEAAAATALHWDRGELFNHMPSPDNARSLRDLVGPLCFGLQVAMGGRVILKVPTSIGTSSKIYVVIAVIAHVPMEVGT